MKRVLSKLSLLITIALLCGIFALPERAAGTGDYAAEVARLVNEERAGYGLGALRYGSRALDGAAQRRAEELAANPALGHTRPDGSDCLTVFAEYGIPSARPRGENAAGGQRTPAEVMADWMASAGHRANILNAGYNWIGVGVCERGGMLYWVQLFVCSESLTAGEFYADPATVPYVPAQTAVYELPVELLLPEETAAPVPEATAAPAVREPPAGDASRPDDGAALWNILKPTFRYIFNVTLMCIQLNS